MGETQENWVAPQNGQSHDLKYDLQLKTKDGVTGGKSVMEGDPENHSKQGYGCYKDLSHCFLH